jgi:hypothetical protein
LGAVGAEWNDLFIDGTANIDSLVAGSGSFTSISTTGDMTFGDNDKAIFGAGSDLQIYHDGSNSYIDDDGAGNLFLRADNQLVLKSKTQDENYLQAIAGGELRLFHDGVQKLRTEATGIDVTGTVTADGLTVDGTATISEGSSGSTASSDSNTLVVENNGNAGMAILTPDGSSSQLRLGDVTDSSSAFVQYNSTANLMTVGTSRASGELRFATGNVGERVRIDANGNVGIGTSSPSRLLHVRDTSSQTVAVFDGGSNGAGEIAFRANGTSGDTYVTIGAVANDMVLSAGASERMRIDSSGNVGIGTSSPGSALEVVGRIATSGGSADIQSNLFGAGDGSETNPSIRNIGDSDTGFWFPAANTIGFSTGGSEAMRIASSGTLLVGKTSSTSANVGVELRQNGVLIGTTSGIPSLLLNRTTSDGTIAEFRKDNVAVGTIGSSSGGGMFIGSGDTGLNFRGDLDAIYAWGPTGGARADVIDLGYSTVPFKDLYLAGGAYLGGTAAANKLDDYEEGTWTPVIADATSGGNTGTSTTAEGFYTKIGRQVVVVVKIEDIDTTGMTGANNIFIRGLPFAAGSGATGQSQGSLRLDRVDLDANCCGIACSSTSNSSYLTLRQTVDASADVQIKVQDFTSGTADLFATITYFV